MRKEEKISFYSHFIGAVAALTGTFFLLNLAKGSANLLISAVYGFSAILVFAASSLYHAFKKKDNEISFWRKLDHLAIFFMIAGTYTPIAYKYLQGNLRWIMISLQWGFVLIGLFFKIFYLHAPRLLSTLIYLVMGWISIIPIRQFLLTMPEKAIFFFVAGGLSFTTGTIFYLLKKPKFFHEIFHIFILLGGVLHYLLVFIAINS